jgi:hypothetical protein
MKRSILEHPAQPFQGYFAEFIQEACGQVSTKECVHLEWMPGGVMMCVRCPPFVLKGDQVRPSVRLTWTFKPVSSDNSRMLHTSQIQWKAIYCRAMASCTPVCRLRARLLRSRCLDPPLSIVSWQCYTGMVRLLDAFGYS